MFRTEHAQIPGYPLVKDHWLLVNTFKQDQKSIDLALETNKKKQKKQKKQKKKEKRKKRKEKREKKEKRKEKKEKFWNQSSWNQ